ncbi:TrmB family transcriptional regulator [Tengunoibacter tsumagoiensis]|uniref:Transcriptional regulator n=1 Tax=Tengunoibacter tsumagoiensis TaxID=2014871 RepID=A0A402A6I3_9CHLR|nr:helix-turn-helix domain-containing protein [Tengunoibacter tsumagoiensis]GCE14699.1 transcriptional regulator [Tengunoibacter tsumagoiensis]
MAGTTIEEMKHLGFTGSEAQVYLFLLQHPLSTGYEISKGTGLARANIYQALETLTAKHGVNAVSADPVRYAPIPPARLLKTIQEETAERCRLLEKQFAALERPDGVGHFWELTERNRIEARLSEMITRAQHRIAASLWADDLVHFTEALNAARNRGCTVILNLFGEAKADYATIYQHEGPEKVVGGHVIALAVDFEEVLVASLDQPVTGVVTQNRTLVRVVEKFIRNEAYLAALYEHFAPELEAAFGPHLVQLRRSLLPESDAERLVAITTMGSEPISLPSDLQ